MQILIVDDEPMVGNFLARMLEHVGRASFYLEAESAFKDFQPGEYDIALIDLGLEGMPGNELAERLKEIDPGLPCVCITGFPLKEDHPAVAIFDAVVVKPFGLEFLDVIKRFARDAED